MKDNKQVQSLIDHIKSAIDVDPWAKEMAEELLKKELGTVPFCENNDYGQHWKCGHCGTVIRANDKYCRECGRRMIRNGD
jgi:rubrerythrin